MGGTLSISDLLMISGRDMWQVEKPEIFQCRNGEKTWVTLIAEVERLSAQIDAAREMHYPVEIEPSDTICGECSYQLPNGRYLGKVVEYPCPTIRALGGEQ